MRIEHIALWTKDIENMKNFYVKYFNGKSNEKYINSEKKFESYFISFDSGARLEIMQMQNIPENRNDINSQYIGLIHLAFSVENKKNVDELTENLRENGFKVVGEPRTTGDGYYESCILDPDGNRIEIVA